MKTDWYTKILLTLIAVALTLLAGRPVFVPTPSYAERPIEYKVFSFQHLSRDAAEAQLNKLGKAGWDLATGQMFPPGFA